MESWDTATECVDQQTDNNKPDNTDNHGLQEDGNHLNNNNRTVLLLTFSDQTVTEQLGLGHTEKRIQSMYKVCMYKVCMKIIP